MSNHDLTRRFARRHLALGWGLLAGAATLGVLLSVLGLYKVGLLVDVEAEPRRTALLLAVSLAALLGVVNVTFALSLLGLPFGARLRFAGGCTVAASVLLPGGFLLSGLFATAAGGGIGELLALPGALLLATASIITAIAAVRSRQ